MIKYSKILIVLALYIGFSNSALASGLPANLNEIMFILLIFLFVGAVLIWWVLSWVVGKENRFLYIVTTSILVVLSYIFCEYIVEVFSVDDAIEWVTLFVPIFYIPIFLRIKKYLKEINVISKYKIKVINITEVSQFLSGKSI